MKESKRNAWRRIALSLALACLFGILVYTTLMGLSTAAANDPANRGNGEHLPTVLDDTDAYTTFLPIVLNWWCTYQSARPPLQGTANFAGEVEILTPRNCTTGLATETPILTTGTYTGTPAGVILWVLAYAPTYFYYPQSPNACEGKPPSQGGGNWQVPVYLGEKGGDAEWFDIVVIVTDQEASDFLGDWVQQGCQSGKYSGIPAAQLEQMNITDKGYISVQTVE